MLRLKLRLLFERLTDSFLLLPSRSLSDSLSTRMLAPSLSSGIPPSSLRNKLRFFIDLVSFLSYESMCLSIVSPVKSFEFLALWSFLVSFFFLYAEAALERPWPFVVFERFDKNMSFLSSVPILVIYKLSTRCSENLWSFKEFSMSAF